MACCVVKCTKNLNMKSVLHLIVIQSEPAMMATVAAKPCHRRDCITLVSDLSDAFMATSAAIMFPITAGKTKVC